MTPDEALRGSFRRSAIVHDWLTIPGGSEKVLFELMELLPDADLFTSVYDPARWPGLAARPRGQRLVPRPPAGRAPALPQAAAVDEPAFRVVRPGRVRPGRLLEPRLRQERAHAQPTRCTSATATRRCATPGSRGFLAGELGAGQALCGAVLLARLRRNDLAGREPARRLRGELDHVAARIRALRRDAIVVHPPVDVERYLHRPRREDDYYLVLGRVVPYKRVDLAVAACAASGGR